MYRGISRSIVRVLLTGLALVILVSPCFTTIGSADEIVIKESNAPIISGDFNCSTYLAATTGAFPIVPETEGIRAGELWTFFDSQGVKKMDRLVLCLDISPDNYKQTDLASIRLQIRDSENPTRIIEEYSLDANSSIVLPGNEASEYRAEAQLAVDLGYDFMEKFSESSSETVVLNVEINGESIVPEFYITGQAPWLSGLNWITMGAFAGFWIIVFIVLFRFTNPDRRRRVPRSKRMLST